MAMGDGTKRGSTTALAALTMLCIAGSEHDAAVRLEDAVAPRLINWRDRQYAGARVRALHPLIRRLAERRAPGVYGYMTARVHHIDALVRREVAAGLDELVILGAGYDTRAHRMCEDLAGVQVFEVDHPATQREKHKRLAKILDPRQLEVTYVQADLTHQNLLERLTTHGHQMSARTLFLLSGVAMYLPEHAVLRLFNQIATHTSSRTSLVFDYVEADMFIDPASHYGASEWVSYATRVGEEPRSGIPTAEIETVLAAHKLRLDSHLNANDLTVRYLLRADETILARPYDFFAIAHAFTMS
jgi:methyltransferase (TIGR00027 family)